MRIAAAGFLLAASLQAQELTDADAARLRCAHELFGAVAEQVWPGWSKAPDGVLLVTADHEFLISRAASATGFASTARRLEPEYHVLARQRVFDPALLATFPVVSAEPVIVVGTPAATRKSEPAWLTTLLHEHFHQLQYSQPWYYEKTAALGLSKGDTTGMWMLNYEFPYGDPTVNQAYADLSHALGRAVRLRGERGFAAALREAKARWQEFRATLSDDDYAYFRLQAWQEGAARYAELLAARAAAQRRIACAGEANAAEILDGIHQSLDRGDLGSQRRVAFYAAGAAIALLLDETSPGWKRKYFEQPFALESYFAP